MKMVKMMKMKTMTMNEGDDEYQNMMKVE